MNPQSTVVPREPLREAVVKLYDWVMAETKYARESASEGRDANPWELTGAQLARDLLAAVARPALPAPEPPDPELIAALALIADYGWVYDGRTTFTINCATPAEAKRLGAALEAAWRARTAVDSVNTNDVPPRLTRHQIYEVAVGAALPAEHAPPRCKNCGSEELVYAPCNQIVTGAAAEEIRREIQEGTPDTPERIAMMQRADELFKQHAGVRAATLSAMPPAEHAPPDLLQNCVDRWYEWANSAGKYGLRGRAYVECADDLADTLRCGSRPALAEREETST